MNEQSKAAQRRSQDWHYRELYFIGHGIDVGSGPDGLSNLTSYYPKITSVRDWDLVDGDAQKMDGIPSEGLDFLSASHVLEHLDWPLAALGRWLDVLKQGGHLIVTVPDYEMYERSHWPSRFGVGHKTAFTTSGLGGKHLINVQKLILPFLDDVSVERVLVIREHFNPDLPITTDQTLGPAECAIEFVLRKL